MSYSTALGVIPGRRPVKLQEFGNAHGWGPSIWRRLLVAHGHPENWITSDYWLNRLWAIIEELPEWQQAALVLTFDTGVIPYQEFKWAAEQLEEFERQLPEDERYVNHVPAMAELLASGPEAPLFGVWGTSVTENPFDPWDYEADAPGSGLPFFDADGTPLMYVLGRHRHHLPELTRRTGGTSQ